jgi:hypothetical protein
MREEAIVLLAAASSMIFLIAGARAQSDLHPRFENISRESLLAQNPARWGGSTDDLERRRIVSSVRMITWSVCSAPSSGSALSIYSLREKAARFLPVSAMQDDIFNDQCANDDD